MPSPSPVPPWVRVVEASAWRNGSKRCSAFSGSMPIPVSATSKRTRRPVSVSLARGDAHGDLAERGELDRVGDQVGEDLPEAEAVAVDAQRRAALDERAQVEVLGAGVLGEHVDGRVDRLGEVELGALELELAGLDLRQVEDVVDDRQQRVARRAHHRRVAALLLVELGVEQQLRHPDHAVHRRADLVAHVGQELRLHARGLERLVARGRELHHRPAALDEEPDRRADRAQQLAQLLVRLVELAAVELDRAEAAVAGDDREADRA